MMGNKFGPPVVMGDESIMSKKAHGTSAVPVQSNLRWDCDHKTAVSNRKDTRCFRERDCGFQIMTTAKSTNAFTFIALVQFR